MEKKTEAVNAYLIKNRKEESEKKKNSLSQAERNGELDRDKIHISYRDGDRQTETKIRRDRQTERKGMHISNRDRGKHRERQRNGETEGQTHREKMHISNRDRSRQTDRQTERER